MLLWEAVVNQIMYFSSHTQNTHFRCRAFSLNDFISYVPYVRLTVFTALCYHILSWSISPVYNTIFETRVNNPTLFQLTTAGPQQFLGMMDSAVRSSLSLRRREWKDYTEESHQMYGDQALLGASTFYCEYCICDTQRQIIPDVNEAHA